MSKQFSLAKPNMSTGNKSAVSSSSSSSSSQTKDLIKRGQAQLWNLDHPYLIPSFIFRPLRTCLFDPTLTLTAAILPPLTGGIPLLDYTMASSLKIVALPFRILLLGSNNNADSEQQKSLSSSSLENDNDGFRTNARHELLSYASSFSKYQPPSDFVSSVRGAVAFLTSTTSDIIGAIMDPSKMNKWMETLQQFNAYLKATGIDNELEEAIMKPLWKGRLFDNLKILNDVQEMDDGWDQRITKLRSRSSLSTTNASDKVNNKSTPASLYLTKEDMKDEIQIGHRMMRFATAAYGTEMVRSALDEAATSKELEDTQKSIAFHTKIDSSDIVYMNVHDGGDMTTLRYFIAIDHQTKMVVLAIRGTLSISGALVDMQGMDVNYCDVGRAHKGIADMAHQLWDHCGTKINNLFESRAEDLEDYGLCITGHSLGAGAACLLHIKVHVESLLMGKPRRVQCYGFAPPPTFFYDASSALKKHQQEQRDNDDDSLLIRLDKAIQNTVAYIHDNDCVPHLSVSSIRRLASLMDAVDNETEQMWAYQRFKIFWELSSIPQNIFDSVRRAKESVQITAIQDETATTSTGNQNDNSSSTSPAPLAKLEIPARLVVWVKQTEPNGRFEAFGCSPTDVANMDIFISQDMINDHMPEMYEDALDSMV